MWEEAERVLKDVRFYGDLAVEAFFLEAKPAARERRRIAHLTVVQRGDTKSHRERLAEKRMGHPPLAPFHWEIEFPEVFERENHGFDAFVGNPPFLGGKRISTTFGGQYRDWLSHIHAGASRNTDLVAHFFRRAFGQLRGDGCLGLIATNTISQGDTRAGGLRWICKHGGEIYGAVTRTHWPGQAAVVVSVVHLVKGSYTGQKKLDRRPVAQISAFLFHGGGHDDPVRLRRNLGRSFVGSYLRGMGFTFDDTDVKGVASSLAEMERLIWQEPKNGEVVFPYLGGRELNSSPTHSHHRYVINFGRKPLRRAKLEELWCAANGKQRSAWLRDGIVPIDYPGQVAEDWPDLLAILEARVKSERRALPPKNQVNRDHRARWWQFAMIREELYAATATLPRVLAIARVGQQAAFAFLPNGMTYAETLVIFPLDTHAAFCALQSRPHEIWARFFGSSMKDDLRYTPSDVFETFPFPRNWTTDPTLEAAGQTYYEFRADLMVKNNEGLTKTYNRFHDPHERDSEIAEMRILHTAMDRAVLDAYGWTDIPTECEFLPEHPDDDEGQTKKKKRYRYRWPDPVRDEVLGRLLKLNAERAEEERRGAARAGKKVTATPGIRHTGWPGLDRASATICKEECPQ